MFKNGLELFKNVMQAMHTTLISYVQVPVAYISSLVLVCFEHFLCLWFFVILLGRSILDFLFITEWQHCSS